MEQLLQQIEALQIQMAEMLAMPRDDRERLMNRLYDIAEELEESIYGPIGAGVPDLRVIDGGKNEHT